MKLSCPTHLWRKWTKRVKWIFVFESLTKRSCDAQYLTAVFWVVRGQNTFRGIKKSRIATKRKSSKVLWKMESEKWDLSLIDIRICLSHAVWDALKKMIWRWNCFFPNYYIFLDSPAWSIRSTWNRRFAAFQLPREKLFNAMGANVEIARIVRYLISNLKEFQNEIVLNSFKIKPKDETASNDRQSVCCLQNWPFFQRFWSLKCLQACQTDSPFIPYLSTELIRQILTWDF